MFETWHPLRSFIRIVSLMEGKAGKSSGGRLTGQTKPPRHRWPVYWLDGLDAPLVVAVMAESDPGTRSRPRPRH